jgi:hypothetical protein
VGSAQSHFNFVMFGGKAVGVGGTAIADTGNTYMLSIPANSLSGFPNFMNGASVCVGFIYVVHTHKSLVFANSGFW